MSAGLKRFTHLKEEVIDAGLCTRCGSCVGVCPEQALQIDDPLGEALPVLVGECCEHGMCYVSCPGKEVRWTELNQVFFGRQPESWLLGNYQDLWVGFAAESPVRAGAASGGILSAASIYLLEQELVDGVISLVDSPEEPYRALPRILTTRAEVLEAAQSRYSISPVNTILSEVARREGVFAYVGLPCQVHSLRKLQAAGHPAALKIRYVLGTYCGNILHFDSVRSFMKRSGVKELSQVASLKYRAGEWPGRMEVRLKSGQVFGLEKFYANYLIPFYILKRCLLCTDLTNEFTDLSGGDGWAPVYNERGKGWSIVAARTAQGKALLDEMCSAGRVELHPIDRQEAINMHSHGLDLKKRGAFLRIERRRAQGKPVPEYGYRLGKVPLARRLQEAVIARIFDLCGTPLARRLIDLLPLEWIGRGFKLLRKVWIKSTRSTKRSGLSQTPFVVEAVRQQEEEHG